jgi:hypothetical protein
MSDRCNACGQVVPSVGTDQTSPEPNASKAVTGQDVGDRGSPTTSHVPARGAEETGAYQRGYEHYLRQMEKKFPMTDHAEWGELSGDEQAAWAAGFEAFGDWEHHEMRWGNGEFTHTVNGECSSDASPEASLVPEVTLKRRASRLQRTLEEARRDFDALPEHVKKQAAINREIRKAADAEEYGSRTNDARTCESCETRPASPWCNGCIVEDHQAAEIVARTDKAVTTDAAMLSVARIALETVARPGSTGVTSTAKDALGAMALLDRERPRSETAHPTPRFPNGWPQPTFFTIDDDGTIHLEWHFDGNDTITFFWNPEEGPMAIQHFGPHESLDETETAARTLSRWLTQRSAPTGGTGT